MLVSSVIAGTLAGLALRGSWRNLRELRLHWWPVALLALAARAAGILFPLPPVVHLFAIVAIVLVALRNVAVPGAAAIALGSALNALVIGLNDGMPYDTAAAVAVGARPLVNDQLHIPIGPGTRASLLADIIPIGLFRNVYSVGDVFIAIGGFWLPFATLRRR